MRVLLQQSVALALLALMMLVGSASAKADRVMGSGVGSQSDTCAHKPSGRLLGCLSDVYSENLSVATRGRWIFLHDSYGPKELDVPPADTAGERLRPGEWRIMRWPSRRFVGRAVASNSAKTRWRVINSSGKLVATARGSEGHKLALVILGRITFFDHP